MKVTQIVIVAIIAFVLVGDLILGSVFGKEGTISSVIIAWSKRYPFIAFAAGFLAGHLFAQE
jgi:hypothetical protein